MLLLCMFAAIAGAGMEKIAEAASAGGGVWLADGELIVGNPEAPGRPGLQPLQDYASITLPEDMTGWTALSGSCGGTTERTGAAGTLRVELQRGAAVPSARVTLHEGDTLIAESNLAPGVTPCAVWMGELDDESGEELVVIWRVEGSVGVTVWRAPSAAPPSAPASSEGGPGPSAK